MVKELSAVMRGYVVELRLDLYLSKHKAHTTVLLYTQDSEWAQVISVIHRHP